MKSFAKLPVTAVPGAVSFAPQQIKLLAAAAKVASKDPTRPNLSGVYVQVVDGEFQAHATDGHRAVVLTCPAEGTEVRGVVSLGGLKLLAAGASAVPVEPSAAFPELARIMPFTDAKKAVEVYLNPDYLKELADFLKCYKSKSKSELRRVKMRPVVDGGAPLVWDVLAGGETVGVYILMPMRG